MRPIHVPAQNGPGVVVPHEATSGAVSFVEQRMAPRHLIRKHVHERTDVWIYVIEGLVGVRVGQEEAVGTTGSYLLKPRGVPHAMWNPGDEPNHLIEVLTPGEGDLFFRDARNLPEGTTRAAFEEMAARHGITFSDDWTDDLVTRYELQQPR